MSQENVETMRRWLEAISSEDFDAALAMVHPDMISMASHAFGARTPAAPGRAKASR